MTAFSDLLQQFSARYHKALVARSALTAGLGSGCCVLLAWRLLALRVEPVRSVGIPAVLAVGLCAAVGIWLRKRWMPPQAAAEYLDRALGLKQRLVTAQEFEGKSTNSPLYAALVQDLSTQVAARSLKTPRPFNHTTGVLLTALLLLLLWPRLNPILPPGLRQPETPPQMPKPNEPQIPPPQDKSEPNQAGSNASQPQQQQPSGQQQKGQGQSQGSNQQQQVGSSGKPQEQAGNSPENNQGSGSQGPAQNSAQQSSANQPPAKGDQSPSGNQEPATSGSHQQQPGAQSEGSSADSGEGKPASNAAKQDSIDQQSEQAKQASQKEQPGSGNQQPQRSAQQKGGSKQESQSGAGKKQESPNAREGSGPQGAGQSLGNGEELKADIQKLLKEMSSDLKDLQSQLDAAKDQPKPQAGTGTDPNLYGNKESMDPVSAKSPVPLQLEADKQASDKSGRPAGGVGKASGDISKDAPQMQAQPAQLADDPLEENAAPRQPIPVEYRSVFDQLRKRDAQPAGGNKP